MAVPETSSRIAEAQKLAKSDPSKAEQIFKDVLSQDPGSNETAIKNYESALIGLGELYRDQKRVDALAELVNAMVRGGWWHPSIIEHAFDIGQVHVNTSLNTVAT